MAAQADKYTFLVFIPSSLNFKALLNDLQNISAQLEGYIGNEGCA